MSPSSTSPAATKNIAESKKLAENVSEVLENGRIESLPTRIVHAGVAKAIVKRAFLAIDQDRVGLCDFLEFFLGLGALRITVGMVLHGELAIGTFDFLLGRSANHSQHLVVITFDVSCDGFQSFLVQGSI